MNEKQVECSYWAECSKRNHLESYCKKCLHNRIRNKKHDFFEESNDEPLPDKCPILSYDGTFETTRGYKCPVCGKFTRPPLDNRDKMDCFYCGYELNI